jgi:hypothetical protein
MAISTTPIMAILTATTTSTIIITSTTTAIRTITSMIEKACRGSRTSSF